MIEQQIDITTPDGAMPTFVFHPEEGGPYPVVLYYMDAPSIRPALMDMASRLSTAGYYVMLPFLYYRDSPFRIFGQTDAEMHERTQLMSGVTPERGVVDGRALLEHAAADPMAAEGPVGAVGFCMSGRLALRLADELPDRVAAVASIHGAWLVNDTPESPHRMVDRIRAEVYFGWADDDPTAPLEDLEAVRTALEAAGVNHTIDFMAGAVHGYAPPYTERYDRAASERHWERVHALLRRTIG